MEVKEEDVEKVVGVEEESLGAEEVKEKDVEVESRLQELRS